MPVLEILFGKNAVSMGCEEKGKQRVKWDNLSEGGGKDHRGGGECSPVRRGKERSPLFPLLSPHLFFSLFVPCVIRPSILHRGWLCW